jgi:methyl-accepting chemotaxis protein
VQQAATGTRDVTGNIAGVTDTAGRTGLAAGQVLGAADELTRQSERLQHQVDSFLADIRGR